MVQSILIMGGNQFVGKSIGKYFIKEGYKVYLLNRGTRENLQGAIHLKCDRNNIEEMNETLAELVVDTIIDISCYSKKEIEILQNTMKGRYRQHIFISSASVYNDINSYPVKEIDKTGENPI